MARTTTNSSRGVGVELSLRLNTLRSFYQNQHNIWDIGCDHGLLGLSFTDIPTIQTINLVDPSKPVIDVLSKKIKDSYISKGNILIHLKEGQKLKIESSSNCIFIAGMGGKEIGQIIETILPDLDQDSQIVISPHRKILELRELLNSLKIALIDEKVILEDGQFYQIIVLKPQIAGPRVPLYGEKLWDTETGRQYLDHQIRFFETHRDDISIRYVAFLKSLLN
jgi:tRNA (adenine22-N1)-methyltransferase